MEPERVPAKSSRHPALSLVVMSMVSMLKESEQSVAAAINVLSMYTPNSVPLKMAILFFCYVVRFFFGLFLWRV